MGTLGLPDAIPELVDILNEYGARWWVLDPVNKHFSRDMDPDSKRDVAMVLGELAAAANTHRATVIGSIHLGRGKEGITPADTWAHSMEFRRAIRSGVMIGKVESDGDDDRTVVHDFSNYGKPARALKAQILSVNGTGAMMLGAEDPFIEPEDLFWRPKTVDGSTRRECADRIVAVWTAAGRPTTMPASSFSQVAHTYSNGTVARARESLGIVVQKTNDERGRIHYAWDFSEVSF
jgi:hypothetical protein